MKTTTIILTAILLAVPTLLRAGSFQDSLKVNLNDTPAIYATLISALDFKEREWGNAPFIPVDPSSPSKGYRAIWTFEAKPKGDKGEYTMQVQIAFVTTHFDANGNPSDPANAAAAERYVEGVTIIEKSKKS